MHYSFHLIVHPTPWKIYLSTWSKSIYLLVRRLLLAVSHNLGPPNVHLTGPRARYNATILYVANR